MRGKWIAEFEGNLVFRVSSKTAIAIQRNLALKSKALKTEEENAAAAAAYNSEKTIQVINAERGILAFFTQLLTCMVITAIKSKY